ncbi:4a-hydroxytetrahydrobiopterin dehydratase [Cupriavidus necator]|uniref:4a-hydroxytetrahydrobiopterin dehydratase n=1 Tax=Cupriavidus necator TaxID=106590 RepID=UPI0039C1E116
MISTTTNAEAGDPYIFISYRREDTMAAARGLLRFLYTHYGKARVFMDIVEIRRGADWKKSIKEALKRATVFVPIIGPRWLTLTDEHGRRRIEKDDDWVAKEISFSIKSGKRIYPVYIDTPILSKKFIPKKLSSLASLQAFEINKYNSTEDVWRELCKSLHDQDGLPPLLRDVAYPRAKVRLQPLANSELRKRLEGMDGWTTVASPLPGAEHVIRSELHKRFEFSSFNDAIQFMHNAASGINDRQHHPRWENIWRNVDVWLSTWDIQFQISELDISLAIYLDDTARQVRNGIARAAIK